MRFSGNVKTKSYISYLEFLKNKWFRAGGRGGRIGDGGGGGMCVRVCVCTSVGLV